MDRAFLKTTVANSYPIVFAVKHRSNQVRSKSSSGGMFYALAEYIINNLRGVVYGCAFDETFRPIHVRCTTLEQSKLCMGSKYEQSDIREALLLMENDLQKCRYVLFTGTPCQVAAVKKMFVSYDEAGQLITADLVCHGVLSPSLFQEWIKLIEKRRGKKILRYEHRTKDAGWVHREQIAYEDGSHELNTRWSEAWRRCYYDNRSLRPCCYSCPYATTAREGDITLADYWRIEQTRLADFKDNLGVSLVLVNSDKGFDLFNRLDIETRKSTLAEALPGNPMLEQPSTYKGSRTELWEMIKKRDYYTL